MNEEGQGACRSAVFLRPVAALGKGLEMVSHKEKMCQQRLQELAVGGVIQ
jgi:hypothetical protein